MVLVVLVGVQGRLSQHVGNLTEEARALPPLPDIVPCSHYLTYAEYTRTESCVVMTLTRWFWDGLKS